MGDKAVIIVNCVAVYLGHDKVQHFPARIHK